MQRPAHLSPLLTLVALSGLASSANMLTLAYAHPRPFTNKISSDFADGSENQQSKAGCVHYLQRLPVKTGSFSNAI